MKNFFGTIQSFFQTFILIYHFKHFKTSSSEVEKFQTKFQSNVFFFYLSLIQDFLLLHSLCPRLFIFRHFKVLNQSWVILACLNQVSILYCNHLLDLHLINKKFSNQKYFLLHLSLTHWFCINSTIISPIFLLLNLKFLYTATYKFLEGFFKIESFSRSVVTGNDEKLRKNSHTPRFKASQKNCITITAGWRKENGTILSRTNIAKKGNKSIQN